MSFKKFDWTHLINRSGKPNPSGPGAGAPRKPRKDEESILQRAVITWFNFEFSEIKNLLTHIPNGGKREDQVRKKLFLEGVRPGYPDLFLAIPRHGYHGFFIELKTPTGRLNDNQKIIIPLLKAQGYKVEVLNNLEEIKKAIRDYLN